MCNLNLSDCHYDMLKLKVDTLKKNLIRSKMAHYTPYPKLSSHCSQSTLQIVLKFCTEIGHYKGKGGNYKHLKNLLSLK